MIVPVRPGDLVRNNQHFAVVHGFPAPAVIVFRGALLHRVPIRAKLRSLGPVDVEVVVATRSESEEDRAPQVRAGARESRGRSVTDALYAGRAPRPPRLRIPGSRTCPGRSRGRIDFGTQLRLFISSSPGLQAVRRHDREREERRENGHHTEGRSGPNPGHTHQKEAAKTPAGRSIRITVVDRCYRTP